MRDSGADICRKLFMATMIVTRTCSEMGIEGTSGRSDVELVIYYERPCGVHDVIHQPGNRYSHTFLWVLAQNLTSQIGLISCK